MLLIISEILGLDMCILISLHVFCVVNWLINILDKSQHF